MLLSKDHATSPLYMFNRLTCRLKQKFFATRVASVRLNVPIQHIRCQKTPFSERQGFSAKTIDCFPPCQFFKLYMSQPKDGFDAFCRWHREWFVEKQGWRISKKDGGMAGGSLARTVIRLHREKLGTDLRDIEKANPELVNEAIRMRVRHYLDLFDSIRQNGFINTYAPINGVCVNGLYYLNKGHHRTSSLWVLGYKEIEIEVMK